MNRIVEATFIGPDVKLFRIESDLIAQKRKAGQFVILRVHERGERICNAPHSPDAFKE